MCCCIHCKGLAAAYSFFYCIVGQIGGFPQESKHLLAILLAQTSRHASTPSSEGGDHEVKDYVIIALG